MEIKCSSCSNTIIIPQEYPYHSGFSNHGFLYCDNCPSMIIFSTFNSKYVSIVGEKHPWSLHLRETQMVEKSLSSCPFCKTGNFKFSALPRCIFCNEILSNLMKDHIYYYEIGNVLNADNVDVWK